MIETWITEGRLEDPYAEFFVAEKSNVTPDELCMLRWPVCCLLDVMYNFHLTTGTEKYHLRHDMIPTFISKELADKVSVADITKREF